jgi:hypothetical protein
MGAAVNSGRLILAEYNLSQYQIMLEAFNFIYLADMRRKWNKVRRDANIVWLQQPD